MLLCVTTILGCDAESTGSAPSFFALGDDVYHARERIEAEQQLLQFSAEPRWFAGFPQVVTDEEFAAWEKQQEKSSQQETVQGERVNQIPTRPAFPKSIADLPVQDQGASLRLAVEHNEKVAQDEIIFTLTLSSGKRAIQREIEHRRTNVLPFLFAFTADSKQVSHQLRGGKQGGGTNQWIELVPTQSQKTWTVRASLNSLAKMLPKDAGDSEIFAVFSERQHEYYEAAGPQALEEVWSVEALKKRPPQILLRSNGVRLHRAGEKWSVK
jgi:hypothetical protein